MNERTPNPATPDMRAEPELLDGQTADSQGRLELREERAVVEKTRRVVGAVTVGRKVISETVQVPVELRREVLVLQVAPNGTGVLIDGEMLEPGETREVLIYAEEAEVGKRVVVAEEVTVGKQEVVENVQQTVSLSREVLDVDTTGKLKADGDAVRREP